MEYKHTTIFLLLPPLLLPPLLLLLPPPLVVHIVYARHDTQAAAILAEKAALLAFKAALTPESQAKLASWNTSSGACDFAGVKCDRWRIHVKRLRLQSVLLRGPLSPRLADLSGLRELDLSDNLLTGSIPPGFSNLSGLRELDLSDNLLTGSIPPEFADLKRLEILDLLNNKLTGEIPASLARLGSLGYLNLGTNSLEGGLPSPVFLNCTNLIILDLSGNTLSGDIPSSEEIRLPSLSIFNLYSNSLHGEIPPWLSNSTFLDQLDVENNYLSGELPWRVVSSLKHLEVLHLSYNQLRSHDNNTNLLPFFSALSNCSELKELEIAGTGLGGRLPSSIGHANEQLSTVYVKDNLISGPIPPGISNLRNLTLLNLSNNLLHGEIPEEIGLYRRIEQMIMSGNFLKGTIPSSIGNISTMGLLDLSDNDLEGEIPSALGDLARLSELHLHNNRLTREIPASLGRCTDLNKLDLSFNNLTGRVPPQISGIAKIFLNLSHNELQGTLPAGLGEMDQVEEIDLSSNNLSGQVIPQFSACVAVKLINLSHNSLLGRLPEKLGDLKNLQILDVSFNSLTGEIPLSLNTCKSLTQLNLSYNNFDGVIPSGGVFSLFGPFSYVGNPQLCGSVSGNSCLKRRRWIHSWKFLVTVCAIASIMAVLLTIGAIICMKKFKVKFTIRKDLFGNASPAFRSSYPRITHRELSEATGGFDQERLIGTGSYGHVYRGALRDGTEVAVKVLQLKPGNSTKSFSRECQVLKSIRHRNLMKIITACSLPDFKALVLPFMANGSLEHRIYESSSSSPSSCLNLTQRVNICSDIAEGMAYLHHHSPVKVIHCDLKPSNVLLNNELTALVSDFGISRLVIAGGGGSTHSDDDDDSTGNTTANMLCGSIGYIAPEYGFGSSASTSGDVYSFGVVVLEVVTRRRPTEEMFEGGMSLQKWVRRHYHGRMEEVVDPYLAGAVKGQPREVRSMWEAAIAEMLELGVLCAQESPAARPTMLDAADALDRLKRYFAGDTTATTTFASSLGMSSSTFDEDLV